jgi:uncharacterized protein (DUF1330 family)
VRQRHAVDLPELVCYKSVPTGLYPTQETARSTKGGNADMAAYVIADLTITDPQGFEAYRQMVPATIAKYGGKYVVRGGSMEALEGEWQPKRLVVIEFESAERAKQWWACEEYREAKAIRQRAAHTNLLIVEGV